MGRSQPRLPRSYRRLPQLSLMALSEAAEWFGQADPRFGENIRAYYERVREQDLLTTHTLIPAAGKPLDRRRAAGRRTGARRACGRAGRQRDRRPRRADAGHDRPDRRRTARVPFDRSCEARRRTSRTRSRSPSPATLRGCSSSAGRTSTTAASIRSGAASTRSTLWSSSTM